MTTKKLYECPTSIKECLDWLVCLNTGGGHSQCFRIIKKLVVSGSSLTSFDIDINELCKKTSSFLNEIKQTNHGNKYEPSYSKYGASWSTLCSPTSNKSCCESNGKNCDQCQSTSGKDCPGCCSNCPKQICARIFCLIVPVLWSVLDYLETKCKNGWSSQTIKGNGKDTDLKNFLTACGFDTQQLNGDMNGSVIKDKLKDVVTELGKVKENIYKALKDNTKTNYFLKPNGSTAEPKVSSDVPKSISDMLQWMIFLPYSSKFKKVLEDNTIKTHANGLHDSKLKDLLHRLPLLFLSIEGTTSSFFSKIGSLSKCEHVFNYGNESDSAKTLIGIIPILHSVFQYLDKKCKTNGNDGWSTQTLKGDQAGKKDLHTFLTFMGFNVDNTTNGTLKGSDLHDRFFKADDHLFKKLEKVNNEAKGYFEKQSTSSTTSPPTTIRQMMLWLIGLPLTKQYGNGNDGLMNTVKTKIVTLNGSANDLTDANVKEKLSDSIVGFLTVFSRIEGNLTSVLEFLKEGFKDGASGQNNVFDYGKDGADCLKKFCEYTYKVHTQLRFLYEMCRTKGQVSEGSWYHSLYANTPTCNTCRTGDSATKKCSAPLKYFLTNDDDKGKNHNRFKNGDPSVTMGFNKPGKYQALVQGSDIANFLSPLLDTVPTTTPSSQSTSIKPLTLLTQYMVAIGQLEPTSLGDYMEFFRELCQTNGGTEMWKRTKTGNGQGFEDALKGELNACLNGQTNGGDQCCEQLKKVIEELFPNSHSSSGTATPHSALTSLVTPATSCTTNSCAPYMKSLSYGLYKYYVPDVKHVKDKFDVFQWLYDKIRKLLDEMKELKKAFKECQCCTGGSPCTDLISCPYAHPILYKFGFTFGDPSKLKKDKKCTNLKDQLGVVLSIGSGDKSKPGSALFKVFEKIIEIVYKILQKKAVDKVETVVKTWKKQDNDQTKTHFEDYVKRALWDSYPKLMCTFACGVFETNHECKTHCTAETHKPKKADGSEESAPPLPSGPTSASTTISITSDKVTSILPIIPTYTPPHIDPYHYHTYQKDATKGTGGSTTTFTFKDSIDFHLPGSQCITPPPISLRQIIDWLLRVTVGPTEAAKKNERIEELSKEVKDALQPYVNNSDKLENGELSKWITSLVQGLRTFVGYKDGSETVTKEVKEKLGNDNGNSVKKILSEELEKLESFLGSTGSASFGTELGKALLKGRYEVGKGTALGDMVEIGLGLFDVLTGKKYEKGAQFQHLVTSLTKVLDTGHTSCDSTVKCKDITFPQLNSNDSVSAQGLSQLYEFFSKLKDFAEKWESIGKSNGNGLLQTQKGKAATEVSKQINGSTSSPTNGQYFTQLHDALTKLGACATKVQALNGNGSVTTSENYRTKITQLIEELNKAMQKIKGPEDSSTSNSKADPNYAVNGAAQLIKQTKKQVEMDIKDQIKNEIEGRYKLLTCNVHSQSASQLSHIGQNNVLCLESLILAIETVITTQCEKHKSHLDDLKLLCQWLYRMGQLYKHGLKGFIESLVKHLEHIVDVIKWMEGISKMIGKLEGVSSLEGKEITVDNFNDLQKCCDKNGHNNLYNTDKFNNYKDFFTALNCRFDRVLHSYTIQDSSAVQDTDKTYEKYRSFLHRLRLLALDRYTLQVWQDNKESIKDWIVFNGEGVVKGSAKEKIIDKLKELTGMSNVTDAASSDARNRVHNFHAVCVIQKFSYEAPIKELEESVRTLDKINGMLDGVKKECEKAATSGADSSTLSNDPTVQKFTTAVSNFLEEPYGIYNFARFLHVILGPNHFSAMMRGLKDLDENKDKLSEENAKKKFTGIVKELHEGIPKESEPTKKYTLAEVVTNLTTFITTMKSEYIFSYPVVRGDIQVGTASTGTSLATISDHEKFIEKLTDVKTSAQNCASKSNGHDSNSICEKCFPPLAHMFLGYLPKLYYSLKFTQWRFTNRWGKTLTQSSVEANVINKVISEIKDFCLSLGYEDNKLGDNLKTQTSTQDGNKLSTEFKKCFGLENSQSQSTDTFVSTSLHEIHSLFEQVIQKFISQTHHKALALTTQGKKHDLKTPSTIRDMLHWLSGVPYCVRFKKTIGSDTEGMEEFYERLCDKTERLNDASQKTNEKNLITSDSLEHRLALSCAQSLDVISVIEDPLGRQPLKRLELYAQCATYYYPNDSGSLYYMFVEFLYKVFVPMRFVAQLTGRPKIEGGWERCNFGARKAVEGSEIKNKDDIICHCAASGTTFSCQLALRKLLEGHEKNVFNAGETMVFQLNENKSILVRGSSIHPTLKHTFSTSNVYTVLCRDLVALSQWPPVFVGDMISFFVGIYKFWSKPTNESVRTALEDWIRTCPGTFEPKELTGALEKVVKEHNGGQAGAGAGTHTDNLTSLMNCEDALKPTTPPGVNCSPYLKPMAYDIYTVFVPQFARSYLSWILHFGPGIYGALKELHEELGSHDCKSKESNSSIVQCPFVLPRIYTLGLDFWDANKLKEKNKTCNNLIQQLDKVLYTCEGSTPSPLHKLIETIEQFLWSIRLPFAGSQLALWCLTLCFLCYVFVVPLDHFHIRSHYFNKLRFTIHPSLLLAHQQRRVSEVSYFFV